MSEETAGRPEHPDVVAQAAAEQRELPTTAVEAADLADKYDRMMRLADFFDDTGEQMRERAALGGEILADPAFTDSAPLSPGTHARAEEDVRQATNGKRGLLTRSIELDADALVLRATVLTYRWIDELQAAAYETLGAIAGRAIGYLAPEVALGGAVVAAGLIETDALDRDGVAAYLNELAESNPELMEHVTSGGGGLLDALQMRAVLTTGVLSGERGRLAAHGGRRAAGVAPMPAGFSAALRDVAGSLVHQAPARDGAAASHGGEAPDSLGELLATLSGCTAPITVHRAGADRWIAYLTGPDGAPDGRRLRLVGGDHTAYAAQVVRALEQATGGSGEARVMLVGAGAGGVTAVEVAGSGAGAGFVVDQVVTAGSPSAHVPRVPAEVRVLSLEDRGDPVAVLGSLVNADAENRVTVVFDGAEAARAASAAARVGRTAAGGAPGADTTAGSEPAHEAVYVAGARAADAAAHPELRAEIAHLRDLGYLAAPS
ncbi:hypothetical protein [Nocardioides nanhaiensis]|uniref:DUF222 domain-containing protein n=1 Tax=Nocardioides nanhaiensis TaxID=1476871 RepID=A0ABP8WDP6_9ACTN